MTDEQMLLPVDEQKKIQFIEQNLIKAGLNWNVRSEGIKTYSGLVVPDRIALVREDTLKVLGDHTKSYHPYQNAELLELLYNIGRKTGLEMHTGGSFDEGKKVWFQLKSNDLKLGTDEVKGFISGFNSFDGKTALSFGTSNLTVSCKNTFWKAYRQVDTKLRHSGSMRPRIEEILRKIDVLMAEEKDNFRTITRMNEIRMTPEIQNLITHKLFELSMEESLEDPEFSTNLKNRMIKFDTDLKHEISEKGSSFWGLFSSVTRYTTHSMKKGDNAEGKMFGKAGKLERQIWDTLVDALPA
jgi:phage/plasmid-like protein (TIGR03299 family)